MFYQPNLKGLHIYTLSKEWHIKLKKLRNYSVSANYTSLDKTIATESITNSAHHGWKKSQSSHIYIIRYSQDFDWGNKVRIYPLISAHFNWENKVCTDLFTSSVHFDSRRSRYIHVFTNSVHTNGWNKVHMYQIHWVGHKLKSLHWPNLARQATKNHPLQLPWAGWENKRIRSSKNKGK